MAEGCDLWVGIPPISINRMAFGWVKAWKSFSSSPEYCFPLLLFKRSFLYRVKPLSKLWFYNKSKREALEGQRKRKSENKEGQFQEIKSNRIGLSPLPPKFKPIGFRGWNQDYVCVLRSWSSPVWITVGGRMLGHLVDQSKSRFRVSTSTLDLASKGWCLNFRLHLYACFILFNF